MAEVFQLFPTTNKKIDSLDTLFDHQKSFAEFCFKQQDSIIPMWVGQDAEGIIYPMSAPFTSPQEKIEVITTVKEIFRDMKVIRYVSMLESWVVVANKADKDIKAVLSQAPSENPNRKEAVLLIGEEGSREISGLYFIERDKDNKASLGKFEMMTGTTVATSKWGSLLPTTPPATRH